MWSLILFLMVTACAAVLGSRFMPGEWYRTLAKPPWNPPSWLFGPVWTVLYLGIAVAGWLVWRARRGGISLPVALWIAQLLLNATWSWVFFGLHRPDLALVNIVSLLAVIVAFALASWPVNRIAAAIFIVYACWVCYASTLNFYIWRFNPTGGVQ